MIHLRFVWGYDGVSDAIRLFEHDGDCPTHVDCVMPDGQLLGAHMPWLGDWAGGVEVLPTGYDAVDVTRDPRRRDCLVGLPAPDSAEELFYAFLRQQVGKPYDTTALIGIAANRNWRESDSWFCSELAAAALEAANVIMPLSTVNHHVSPRDLLLVLSARVLVTLPAPK